MGAAYLSRSQGADCSDPPRHRPTSFYRLAALVAGTFICTTVWTLVLVVAGSLAGIALTTSAIAAAALVMAVLCWASLAIVVAKRP